MAFAVKTAYANDYQWFDGVEVVTLTSRNPEGQSLIDVQAVREIHPQEAIGVGDLGTEHVDTVFHVWESTLEISTLEFLAHDASPTLAELADKAAKIIPKNGDSITDADSVSWTVIQTTQNGREPLWRLACRKQVS